MEYPQGVGRIDHKGRVAAAERSGGSEGAGGGDEDETEGQHRGGGTPGAVRQTVQTVMAIQFNQKTTG